MEQLFEIPSGNDNASKDITDQTEEKIDVSKTILEPEKSNGQAEKKEKICVEHLMHCKSCKKGFEIYEEVSPASYARGEYDAQEYDPDYKPKYYKIKDDLFCNECILSYCKKPDHLPFENKNCQWEPEPSAKYKIFDQYLKELHGSCQKHPEHCKICGVGINNELDGTQYKTQYNWYQSQEIYYSEIDHYKCRKCDADISVKKLPSNSHDWTRKQIYLDYILNRRLEEQFEWSNCFQRKENKKIKV